MKALIASLVVAPALFAAAGCATTVPSSSTRPGYWYSRTAGDNQFPGDNTACSARATRLANVSGPAPENRLDRPVQKWSNATAQEIYDTCMVERGWQPAG